MKKIISVVVVLLVGMVIGWLCRPSVTNTIVDIQRDSIVVHDTIMIKEPIYITSVVKDSILVVVKDTIVRNETCYISLPLQKRTYKRDEFYAEVTGYEPRLTYIEVYPKTVYVTEKQSVTKCNRLRLGIEANYCSTLSTPIYLEYERMLHRNIGINAKFFYDLNTRLYGVVAGVNLQVGW